MRLALVHEFRTRSKVLVCTEAGAKGLNLQFCETVINYDLPWNPQRIEQRIGRCHRYSQQRDVTVVNFIARDNEAHRLTFEILSQKLDLFGRVLDASDVVLHEPRTDAPEIVVSALSLEFETDLRNIYSRSRTLDEVTREIAALRDKIAVRRDAYEKEYERTSQIIESRFDEDVRRVFKRLRDELPPGLVQLDRDIADLVDGYLALTRRRATSVPTQDGRVVFDVAPGAATGRRRSATDGGSPPATRRGLTDAEPLNLVHPLVHAAIADARAWPGGSVELAAPARRRSGPRGAGRTEPASSRWRWSTTPGSSRCSGWSPAASSTARRSIRRWRPGSLRLQATDGAAARRRRRPALARRCGRRGRVRRSARGREARAEALRAGDRSARAVRRRQGPGLPARAREHRREAAGRAGLAATRWSAPRLASGSRPRSLRLAEQGRGARAPDRRAGFQGRRGLPEMAKRISRASVPGADRDPAVPGGVPDRAAEPGDVVLRLLHTADWHLGPAISVVPRGGAEEAVAGADGRDRDASSTSAGATR